MEGCFEEVYIKTEKINDDLEVTKNLSDEFEENIEDIIDDVWTEEKLRQLIELRTSQEILVVEEGDDAGYTKIAEALDMGDSVTASDVKRKWTNLLCLYANIKETLDNNEGEMQLDIQTDNFVETATREADGSNWVFFDQMKTAVDEILKVSPEKIPQYNWPNEMTSKFINLVGAKKREMMYKGQRPVYDDIIKTLGLENMVTIMMAIKKWNHLIKKYEKEKLKEETRWPFFNEMTKALKNFPRKRGDQNKSRASPEFLWPNELTKQFIELRMTHVNDFNVYGIQQTYTTMLDELELGSILTSNQLRKKWNYLVAKYKSISKTVGPDGTSPGPHSWPFYEDMHNALNSTPENEATDSNESGNSSQKVIWTNEIKQKFIELRGSRSPIEPNDDIEICENILNEMGLSKSITPQQASKKWSLLWHRYLDYCHPNVTEYTRQSWPFFSTMKSVVGDLPLSEIMGKREPSDKKTMDKGQMKASLGAVENEGMSKTDAAKKFAVPRATVHSKLTKKQQPVVKSNVIGPPYITTQEEEVLVQWVKDGAKRGLAPRKDDILNSVQKIIQADPSRSTPFRNGRPGYDWYRLFRRRHPEVSIRPPEKDPIPRGKGARPYSVPTGSQSDPRGTVTENFIRFWFDQLHRSLRDQDLLQVMNDPSRIFNLDETNFLVNQKTDIVITLKNWRNCYECPPRANPDKSTITFIGTFSANGELVTPTIIYPYDEMPKEVIDVIPNGMQYLTSETGWMTADTITEFIEQKFDPWLIENKIKKPVLLFVDGRKLHLTLQFSNLCKSKGIYLYLFPLHSSHILQPADIGPFNLLKTFWKPNLNPKKAVSNFDLAPLLHMFMGEITRESIIDGFLQTGLYPLNVDAIDFSKVIICENSQESENNLPRLESPSNSMYKMFSPTEYKIALDVLDHLLGEEKLRDYKLATQKDLHDIYYTIKTNASVINDCNIKAEQNELDEESMYLSNPMFRKIKVEDESDMSSRSPSDMQEDLDVDLFLELENNPVQMEIPVDKQFIENLSDPNNSTENSNKNSNENYPSGAKSQNKRKISTSDSNFASQSKSLKANESSPGY